jgi:lipopolysaccharide heptosyltransferase III
MKNVLLIRFGGLGDLLVALPSIRLLRGKFPDARLTLACRKQYGELLLDAGVVDEIISEDSPELLPLFDDRPKAETVLPSRLESFDRIVVWTHGGSGLLTKGGIAADVRSGRFHFLKADPRGSIQLSRQFFRKTAEIIGESGALSIDDWAGLPPDRAARTDASGSIIKGEEVRRAVVVHPGSGSESKCWSLENFLEIIRRLGERGIAGWMVTGEAEERMEAALESSALPQGWASMRQPLLAQLASLLSETGLYLGNDSGVTHLAAARGAEVVALFRQDLVAAWEPLGRVHIHIARSLNEIRLESVWETLRRRLPNFSADSQNS